MNEKLVNVHIIRVDGTEERHQVGQRIVMGWIERMIGARGLDTVNLRDGRVMIVDDLGAVGVPRPVNQKGTVLYHSVCRPGVTHQIHGDVAIVVDAEIGE
jgi:hypothetical protein